ncbi:MAG: hypothetical protein WA777_20910 [Rhodanobacter sp.]
MIFPSAGTVPENLLRIEVQLDHPLDTPLDMRHVALIDATGKPIVDALLDIPLPSRDGREVSILLHPGRIKTGVGANERLGMALHRGEIVTLVIDDPQFGSPIRKSWLVTPAIRKPIEPASWKVTTPAVGTREALRIAFPVMLDSAAKNLIAVAGSNGERLPGQATLSNGEARWSFVPDKPWADGQYDIRVHPSLEDPAGNRACSAFEQIAQSALDCHEGAGIIFRVGRAAAL